MTQEDDARGPAALRQIEVLADNLPSMKKKLTIWAVRSVIAVAIAYGVVAMNGPAWLIPAVWIYVAVSLLIGVAMTLYAQKLVARGRDRRALSERNDAQN